MAALLSRGSSSKASEMTATLDLGSVVQRNETLATAPMGEELAMMDLDTGKYLVLDRIGAAIWEKLDEPIHVGDLIGVLAADYDVTREQCESDVLGFLQQLHSRGLVDLVGS
jgi:hypothetical protein